MADRGKVLKALKQHLLAPDVDECVGCPYYELEPHECERQLYQDAVELLKEQLKEQEPVPPWSRIDISPEGTAMVINCGACHIELARVQSGVPFNDVQENVKYCIRCGKAVKWD